MSEGAALSHRYAAPADTARPDPALMRPLPPGRELTMLPDALTRDYWAHGLLHVEPSALVRELDSITGHKGETILMKPRGVAGDPIPYRFRTDNFVNVVLLVSFFLVVWVITRSRHFLSEEVKGFMSERKRDSSFVERTQRELREQIFLVFQTCFVLGLLFFDYTQEYNTEIFNRVSPYLILGMSVGTFVLYFMAKMGLYRFVNTVFFEREKVQRWNEIYLLGILFLGLTLLPVSLLVVYFDLDFGRLTEIFFFVLVVDKSLLLYKCYRIFFSYRQGWVHLFLYFCTLEIAPLLVLFRALIFANSLLLTIN